MVIRDTMAFYDYLSFGLGFLVFVFVDSCLRPFLFFFLMIAMPHRYDAMSIALLLLLVGLALALHGNGL